MEWNDFVFPGQFLPASYTVDSFSEFVFIPREPQQNGESGPDPLPAIPCLFLRCLEQDTTQLLILFHGNGEDIGVLHSLASHIRLSLKVHVLVPEYPGYGIYRRQAAADGQKIIKPTAELILEDALTVFNYFTSIDHRGHQEARSEGVNQQYALSTKALIEVEDVILVGRSIGSAPALELAAYCSQVLGKKLAALVLLSAFESLGSLSRSLLGRVAAYFVRDRFQNSEVIKLVTCPILLIHGKKDDLVPWEHSRTLFNNAGGPCSLVLSDEMTHDSFDFVEDLTQPIYFFMAKVSESVVQGPPRSHTQPSLTHEGALQQQNQLLLQNPQVIASWLDIDENIYLVPFEYQNASQEYQREEDDLMQAADPTNQQSFQQQTQAKAQPGFLASIASRLFSSKQQPQQ